MGGPKRLHNKPSFDPQSEARRCEAFGLFEEGERRAAQGDYERGAQAFRRAKELNDRYNFDPDSLAKKLAAPAVVNRGLGLVREGKVSEALEAFQEAPKLDSMLEIPVSSWNNLCWWGSLHGKAADVLFAGERAVKLAPAETVGSVRDTRGLARALTGQTAGAIEDFQAYLEWAKANPGRADQQEISDRLKWIAELKANRNPFDKRELDRMLKNELEK